MLSGKADGGGIFRLASSKGKRRKDCQCKWRWLPKHRLFTLHAVFWELQVGGFGWGRTNRTYYLYLKISRGMTSKSHFLVGAEEDSSLLLYCSRSATLGGTLSWPAAIRIFLRESPWTKKSVFSFLWKLWCSLWKQRNLDSVQEKCNLQTNSLGKSGPHPQCLGQAQGEPHPLLLSSWKPPPFPLLYVVSGCPKGNASSPCLSLPSVPGPGLCKCSCPVWNVPPFPVCKSSIIPEDSTPTSPPQFPVPQMASCSSTLLCCSG